jgi:hypothetical protein
MEPPDLDTMPMGILTGAMPPALLAPADADSTISLALICDLHGCFAFVHYDSSWSCDHTMILDFDATVFRLYCFKSYGVHTGWCRYLKIFFNMHTFPNPSTFGKQFVVDVGSIPERVFQHFGSDIAFYADKKCLHRSI